MTGNNMENAKESIICVPGALYSTLALRSDYNIGWICNFDNFLIPGQRLCLSDKQNLPGPGTYEQQGYIYSKLAGTVELIKDENVQEQFWRLVTFIK